MSNEGKNWAKSRKDYCQKRGADLIIINNREEQDFVNKITAKRDFWIGLTDSHVEGRWKWVDGSTLISGFYYMSNERKNWAESRQDCQKRGADLIIINNREEQDFVKKITDKREFWIGVTDSVEDGRWKWVDGSTLTSGLEITEHYFAITDFYSQYHITQKYIIHSYIKTTR
ncbi:hypothetical protein cypCar_00047934 [Cyprinus carpio]|nr:hypothetical protein cypCar_00047934 [Cyprinus carpio]